MGQQIRQAMADRNAYYKLADLIQMDYTYFGAPKPGNVGVAPPAGPRCW
jgi:hypothetical protein